MLVRHKKAFNVGAFLGFTFIGILFLIFSPVFGGKNGLEYSDDLFNKLSKGSSYFIPKLAKDVEKLPPTPYNVTVKMDKPETAEKAVKLLLAAGTQVGAQGNEITINADLGKLLSVVLKDSDAMYHNNGAEVASRYGMNEKEAMKLWWTVLNRSIKELQKEKKIDQANLIAEVNMKAIEPAYNYYGIQAQSVIDKAGTMTGLLVFYVLYTMWWGYAIFYMFEGIGLSMKKAKVKKEI